MKLTSSTHNHSTLCDGKNTPAEMAEAALAAGFTDFGFSSHGHAPFDADGCLRSEPDYVHAMRALQRQYAGRLRIAVGIEQDFYAPVQDRAALDYIIGSVHCLRSEGGTYYPVDWKPEMLRDCIREMFGGDAMAMVRAYYALVTQHTLRDVPEIIGHFDLVKKNNGDGRFFDENSAEYRRTALEALERCAASGAVFEVNTGGIFRGYRRDPYPAPFLLGALRELGARVTVNADAHRKEAVCFYFDETLALLRDIGFRAVTVLENGRLVDRPIETFDDSGK